MKVDHSSLIWVCDVSEPCKSQHLAELHIFRLRWPQSKVTWLCFSVFESVVTSDTKKICSPGHKRYIFLNKYVSFFWLATSLHTITITATPKRLHWLPYNGFTCNLRPALPSGPLAISAVVEKQSAARSQCSLLWLARLSAVKSLFLRGWRQDLKSCLDCLRRCEGVMCFGMY